MSASDLPDVAIDENGLEQVVVTARKRAENSLEVPLSITVLSNADLHNRGISNLEDLSAYVPGLDLGRTNTGSAARIYIRGIGQRDPRSFVDPAVGLYVDGVYLSRADGALLDILDLDSIEVLRGPQGALFGKNTIGGAIRLTTRLPPQSSESELRLRLGELNRFNVSYTRGGSLSQNLTGSLALNSVRRDGYLSNPETGLDFSNERRQGLRAQLLWEPNDSLSIRGIADAGRQRERGAGAHCVLASPGTGTLGASPVGGVLNFDAACRQASRLRVGDDQTLVTEGRYDLDSRALTLLTSWMAPSWKLLGTTAVRHQRLATESDQDGSSADIITLQSHTPDRRTQWSQELTLTGIAADNRFAWTAGAYVFNESTRGDQQDAIIGPQGIVILDRGVTNDTYLLGTNRTRSEIAVRSYAVYGQIDWDFRPAWQLGVGLRNSWENRQLSASDANLNPDAVTGNGGSVPAQSGRPRTPNGGIVVLPAGATLDADSIAFDPLLSACGLEQARCEGQQRWRRLTPSLTLSKRFSQQENQSGLGLWFLKYSRGFKAGAINVLSNRLSIADPEVVDNYEMGFKWQSADHRKSITGSAFIADYKAIQVPIAVPPAAGFDAPALPAGIADTGLVNAAQAKIKGGEIEMRFLSSWGLAGHLAIAYLDAGFREFSDDFGVGDRSDESFSGIPQWTVQLGIRWLMPIADLGYLQPRLDYFWQDEVSHHFGHSSFECGCFVQPAFSKLNARLSWILPGDRADLSLYANNFLDKRTYYGASPLVDIIGGGPIFPDAPRTVGVEFSYRW
ncbi:MAG: TonB-dependent receptor [Pseudomonadales bacterium]